MTWAFGINGIVTALLALVPTQINNEKTAYLWTLILCVIFGCSYAVLQATLYGVAGPNAGLTNKLMLGIGLSGLIVNAIRMIFLASITNLNLEAQVFFYGSAVYLLVCTFLSYTFVNNYQNDKECLVYK
jgi:hypothetical protein